ncbi:MAG: type II secretion system protein N [Pseudomonadota bacterium]
MRKLIIAALLALLILIILTLPAGLIIPRFDPPAALGQYSGTIWSGQARWRQAGQVPMALTWRWGWGRHWNWEAFDSESRLQGRWQPGEGVNLNGIGGRLALARMDMAAWMPLAPPQGFLSLALDQVRWSEGQMPNVQGLAIWEDARLAGVVQESLGRIEVRFEPEAGRTVARVRSLSVAPVTVQGTIVLGAADVADRYRIDLWLRAAADRPDLAAQLGTLGQRQVDGQVRLQLEGRLGFEDGAQKRRESVDHVDGS